MAYTKIPKPSASTYINQNFQGKEQYDQANLTYDDAATYYDGVNPNQYTNIAKPTTQTYTKIPKPT